MITCADDENKKYLISGPREHAPYMFFMHQVQLNFFKLQYYIKCPQLTSTFFTGT